MNPIYAEKIHRINTIMTQTDALYHQAALKLGMADSVMRVLYTLHDFGRCCPLAELYRSSGISKQTVNSAIRSLEQEGIVYLAPYRGRTKMVHLTEKGEEYTRQTIARLFSLEIEIFSTWAEEEIDAHIHYLTRYLEDLRTRIPNLTPGEAEAPQTTPKTTNTSCLAHTGEGG